MTHKNMSRSPTTASSRPTLQPSALGKFVQLDACPRYFKFHIEDTGISKLRHDKEDYKEMMLEDNIVEKKHGDDFEEVVLSNINTAVSTVINLEALTLHDVAVTLPTVTREALPSEGFTGDVNDVSSGEFTYYGTPVTDVLISDPSTFIDSVSELTDETDNSETHPVQAAFFELRNAYTEHLFEYLAGNMNGENPVAGNKPFPIPLLEPDTLPAPTVQTTTSAGTTPSETNPIVVYQPTFTASIGEWEIAGDADIVLFWPGETVTHPDFNSDQTTNTTSGTASASTATDRCDAIIRVIDVKMATEEETHQQLQTVTYSKAIEQLPELDSHNLLLETGVITQHASYLPVTPWNVPTFDKESREADLNRLTQKGGVLDTVFNTQFDDVAYQLNSTCGSCQYNEPCYLDTVENAGLEILALGRGVQQQLHNNGIHDLNDLADLAEKVPETPATKDKPYIVDPRESTKPDPDRAHEDVYNRLAEVPGLGEQLPHLIQEAQVLLGRLNPDHRNVRGGRDKAQFLTGSGEGSLPTDFQIFTEGYNTDATYREGSLIRVYLNVQYDHIRDLIAGIGFHVTATASTHDGVSWARVHDTIPDDPAASKHQELELLTEFAERVFDAIERVGEQIDLSGYDQEHPFLHFFTYTEDEKRDLEERLSLYVMGGIDRDESFTDPAGNALLNDDAIDVPPILHQVRGVLGMRGGETQEMITAVLPDIEARMAVPRPTLGLVNVYTTFQPKYDSKTEAFGVTDWKYEPDDPGRAPNGETEINLKSVFRHRLFNTDLPYKETTNSIEFLIDGEPDWSVNQTYETRVRTGAQIPLAYLWGAAGKITDEWVEEVKEDEDKPIVDPYRYHENSNPMSEPITPEDVEALLKRMCECLRHVEQGIMQKAIIEVPKQGDEHELVKARDENETTLGDHI